MTSMTVENRGQARYWTLVRVVPRARAGGETCTPKVQYDGLAAWLEWPSPSSSEHRGGIVLERYDVVIIGGGAAGINAVKTAIALKARVALVDRGPLGGTCVNRG
jgi:NADPH-dependent 2,4-dienoyl-CoA reductase/sulfur reductase-like enzyme